MAEIDTSSYPKPKASKSLLDQVQQYQQLESNAISIDSKKLELAIKNQDQLLATLSALPPDATSDDLKKWGQSAVKMKLVNPKIYAEFVTNMPPPTGDPVKDAEALKRYRHTVEQRALGTSEAMKWKYGQDISIDSGQSTQPGKRDPRYGAIYPTDDPIQKQPEIGTEYIDPDTKETKRIGPMLPVTPPGANPVQGGFAGQYRAPTGLKAAVEPPMPSPRPGRAVPSTSRVVGDAEAEERGLYNKPASFTDRFGTTKRAPGEAEAEVATGQQSGQALATARTRAATFAQDMLPITEALTAVKELGTKGTGPGTETINQVKSFILSNLPGVDANDPGLASVTNFDKARKYLVQIARQTGNTSTNDQLASAFAGNPNINISNAATQDVLSSIAALRKLEQAKLVAWNKAGLPDSQYSKWAATFENTIDPRAFGIDLMSKENVQKLIKRLKPQEKEKLENSIELAIQSGLINKPPNKAQ